MEDVGEIPEMVGAYRVLGVLGTGGMGAVLRAEHTLIGRAAAIKILRPEPSRNRETVTRFFNEAKAAAAIKHPGIVEIYDFGYLPSGSAYLVMELLEGTSLRARIKARGRMTEAEAFGIVRGIAGALAAAHAKGIIHRDIKPDNIYLVPDPEQPSRERVKLLDFGIAKLNADLTGDASSTQSGTVMGTPRYMSPEQCKGAAHVDHRADFYAVGCVLMQLLTGAPPFPELGVGETIGAQLFMPPPTLRSRVPDASDQAEWLVAKLLAKDPALRVQSALELVELTTAAGASASSSAIVSGSMWTPGRADGEEPPITTMRGASLSTVKDLPRDRPVRRRWWPLGAGAAVVAAGVVFVLVRFVGESPPRAPTPAATSTLAAPSTVPAPPSATEAAPPLPMDAGVDARAALDAGVDAFEAIDAALPEPVTIDESDIQIEPATATRPRGSRSTRGHVRMPPAPMVPPPEPPDQKPQPTLEEILLQRKQP